jgi:predicted component of type VI protein secretion system
VTVTTTTATTDAVLLASNGQQFALADSLSIGRGDGASIRLDHAAVSREHAVITYRGGWWWIADRGSRNGTRLNGSPLPALAEHPLRDGDRIIIGSECLRVVLSQRADDDATTSLRLTDVGALSPYQLQVAKCLAEPWLSGKEPASNAEIAASLGTPRAVEAVKAALRRCYVKAGISELPTHTKRRELCRVASMNHWI